MIYIVDNFIEDIYFKLVKSQLTDFKEVKTPGKSFWVMPAHKDFIKYVTNKLTELEGKEIEFNKIMNAFYQFRVDYIMGVKDENSGNTNLFAANKYFNDQEPWKKKNDVKRLDTINYVSLELIRKISILLYKWRMHCSRFYFIDHILHQLRENLMTRYSWKLKNKIYF